MTGDAPQPGGKPGDQGNPWTLADPDAAWWRGERDGEPPIGDQEQSPEAAEAAEARAAGARDLTEGSRLATAGELMIIETDAQDGAPAVLEGVGDQPATDRNRPTVIINAQRPLPDVTVSPEVEARLERLENSPFWMSEQERAAAEAARPRTRQPGRRRRPATRRSPAGPLAALVTLSLLAAFFAWVSAEPFWLAVGHGDDGRATTIHCRGEGLTQRCAGSFVAGDGRFTASRVTLLGISGTSRQEGAVTPARMVSAGSDQAYAGGAGTLMNLRWILGFALVLICGYGIAQSTGAHRLETGMKRRRAVLLSFAAPILLQLGFLAAAF
ncbi:hypothetical protein ACTI_15170 [Actinoplanes sp. OR16]|uniref:hypothetical protein n=1 Tax=Actinoplanes sp. OR16 TaxID=946334 RepID=UPI000F70F3B7|nr:hypothetical protein [Actinoplanes sp. OR16]BBH64832.1 hypothetical protein ACTI_15170 [Actinoplanes sp. OR16]